MFDDVTFVLISFSYYPPYIIWKMEVIYLSFLATF